MTTALRSAPKAPAAESQPIHDDLALGLSVGGLIVGLGLLVLGVVFASDVLFGFGAGMLVLVLVWREVRELRSR